ncbi:MAG: hypothetical protein JXB88_04730 [Spirochaetales bacterium]|nr:hypothetical protein [Spirochaetales bacterium]
MLESILKFNKMNFYQEKVDAIGEVVRNYAKLKLSHADSEAISMAKHHARQTISSIIGESGFLSKDNSYVALDKEFFTDKGLLDEESLKRFQKEVVKHYGLQQLKWSFAGTTLQYTQMTKRELKKQGIQYEELLPQELQLEKEEEKQKSYEGKEQEPNTYRAFLYPDGSVSEAIIPDRMQIRFDHLSDQSGFDWKSGYSPDNEVMKKDWFTGFNKQGEWEKVSTIPGRKSYQPYSSTHRPVDFFAGTKEGSREHDTVGILQTDDGSYLFDDYSFLYEDYEEFYYSITGDVYGAQKVDQEKTLKNLKDSLDKKGVTELKAVVLRQASKDAVKFYKTILTDYVTKKTRFYSRNDRSLMKKLSTMRTALEGKEVSNRVIADLHYLSKRGITKEELKKNLENKGKGKMWEVPLHIFEQESDMETFLMLPAVQEICEEDTIEYLKGMNVPEEKRTVLSNTIQNLMIGYKDIFKYNPVKQTDLIRAAEEYLVKNKTTPVLKSKVTAEESLYTVIKKAAGLPEVKESVSVFIPAKKKDEYKDLFNEQELSGWIQEELKPVFPEETIRALENEIRTITAQKAIQPEILQGYFSNAVQNIFPLFPLIAENTGITPLEIIRHIKGVLLDETGAETLQRKRIFFEKSIKDILKEISIKDAPTVKGEEKEAFQGDMVRIEWKPFSEELNLFEKEDLTTFLTSPLIAESGLKPEQAVEIEEYITSTPIPEKSRLEFSGGLINIIRGYHFQLKPYRISLQDALKALQYSLKHDSNLQGALTENIMIKEGQKNKPDIDLFTLKRVMNVAQLYSEKRQPGKKDMVTIEQKERDPGYTLESIIDYGIDSFLESGLITGEGIPREEALKIYNYLKDIFIPENKKKTFSRAVAKILKDYGKTFPAGEVTALDAVKAVSSYIKGNTGKVSPELQQSIKDIIDSVTSSSLPGNEPGEPGITSDITGVSTFNLLNQDDFNKFIQSDSFKASGLNKEQLNSIIQEYRKAYNQNKNQFDYSGIPIAFNDDVSSPPPQILKGNVPSHHGIKNSLFNVGFVLKAYPGQVLKLLLTKKGEKALSVHKFQGVGQAAGIQEYEQEVMQTQLLDTHQDNEQGDYPYMFTQSYSQKYRTFPSLHTEGQKKTFQSSLNKQTFTNQQKIQDSFTGKTEISGNESTITHKGLTHFQRMENNYFHDKQMLARSSSESGSGKSSEEKKKGSKEDDNVIKQLSDDLIEEMKNKANEEGF